MTLSTSEINIEILEVAPPPAPPQAARADEDAAGLKERVKNEQLVKKVRRSDNLIVINGAKYVECEICHKNLRQSK